MATVTQHFPHALPFSHSPGCSREEGLARNAINSFALNMGLPGISDRRRVREPTFVHFLAAVMKVCDRQGLLFDELLAMAEQKFLNQVDPEGMR